MMRTVTVALALGLMALAIPTVAANPYAPAITVNDSVITHYDIDQRMKLLAALGATGELREIAVEQLTEDRVKLQAGAELGIELDDAAIAVGIEEFATGRGLTLDDVNAALTARGIDQQTMNDFVESGLVWREVLAQRFRARATPSEADLDAALELAATRPREILTLAEIALPFEERGEAETIALADRLYRELRGGASFPALAREYSRSGTAENDGLLEPVPADRLPPTFRTQVLLLSPGQVTRPIPISGGVAIIKLVSIEQRRPDPAAAQAAASDPAAREQLRQQLFSERIASFGQGYLQELLGDALIEER
jgi:peptidyl-prolyl cis-trans isomerase SurA